MRKCKRIAGGIEHGDTVYISGPMSGIENYNRAAFSAAAVACMKAATVRVLNPGRQPDGLPYSEYMRRSFRDLVQATVMVSLPGSDESRGAKAERSAAELFVEHIFADSLIA